MPWLGVSWSLALILAYLVGSLPTAYLAGRMMKGKDIREEGDRNAGAGNVYRMIGPKVGLLVGALDIAKGGIAVLVAKGLTGSVWAEMGAGVVVVAGHNWSIFQGLRGGRGAASTIGVFMALIPIPGHSRNPSRPGHPTHSSERHGSYSTNHGPHSAVGMAQPAHPTTWSPTPSAFPPPLAYVIT